jgi:TPP-dependent 2-oxoacid decarboxylase
MVYSRKKAINVYKYCKIVYMQMARDYMYQKFIIKKTLVYMYLKQWTYMQIYRRLGIRSHVQMQNLHVVTNLLRDLRKLKKELKVSCKRLGVSLLLDDAGPSQVSFPVKTGTHWMEKSPGG